MFLLLGILLAIDAIFLIIVTAVPQAILRAQLEETVLTVSYARKTHYLIYKYLSYCATPSDPTHTNLMSSSHSCAK